MKNYSKCDRSSSSCSSCEFDVVTKTGFGVDWMKIFEGLFCCILTIFGVDGEFVFVTKYFC